MSQSDSSQFSYFQIQGIWGVTKHFGGLRMTEELARRCHVTAQTYLLEVGSGVGQTACYLAEKIGCRVLSIDLSPAMVSWAQQRAARRGLQDRVEFRVADAQQLPFADHTFDAMMCESVTAFVPDKAAALAEYTRVVRPGGYVGLNEGTWVEENPPAELLAYIDQFMGGAQFQKPGSWQALLEGAGLQELDIQVIHLQVIRQRLDEVYGMKPDERRERWKAMGKMISMYLSDPAFRRYARAMIPSRRVIRILFKYLGYGLYIGRVPGEHLPVE
jgi:SAM-dependent methyltransferase